MTPGRPPAPDARPLPHGHRPPTADAATALAFDGVSKKYGGTVAVRDLSMSVERGEILTRVPGAAEATKNTRWRLMNLRW